MRIDAQPRAALANYSTSDSLTGAGAGAVSVTAFEFAATSASPSTANTLVQKSASSTGTIGARAAAALTAGAGGDGADTCDDGSDGEAAVEAVEDAGADEGPDKECRPPRDAAARCRAASRNICSADAGFDGATNPAAE